MKQDCRHYLDGWILKTELVLNPMQDNEDLIAEFECNHLGCNVKKTFRFDVRNMTEV